MNSGTNEKLRNVAEEARKIMMGEKLHPNQQKLDVHEPEKDELTADDFKKLRAGKKAPEVKKEEVEQIEELKKSTMGSYVKKASKDLHNTSFDHGEDEHRQYGEPDGPFGDPDAEETMKKRERDIENRQKGINRAATKLSKEAVEQIDEYKSTGGVYKHKGTYGTEKSTEAGYTDYDKENELAKKNLKDKKPKKYGARQNFVRSTRVNESFTDILSAYKLGGLKSISEMFVKEEPTEEEFNNEIKMAKDKSEGKIRNDKNIAAGKVDAVKEIEESIDEINGVAFASIDEREMTDAEMKKKEDIVKGMKKGMAGFKERYGDRAKEVMYATATKQSMKD
jgi:hypothetical protein